MKGKNHFKKNNLKPMFNSTSNKAFDCAEAKADLAECDLCLGASSQVKANRSFQQSASCFLYRLQGCCIVSEDFSCGCLPVLSVTIHEHVLHFSLSPVTQVLVPIKI